MAASTATLKMLMKAEDHASSVIGGVVGSLGKMAAIAGGALVAGLGVASSAVVKLAIDAAALPAIAQGFETNMEKYGLSAQEMQKQLSQASAGTVNAFEMMKKANLALTGAGEELGHEFGMSLPKLMEIARAAARNTGQDVDYLFDSIVTGIKRGSPMIIDNLGLVLKVSEATDAYAISIGKTAEELTAEERSIAILNATLQAGQGILETVNLEQLTAAERIARLKTRFSELKDTVGISLQPALEKLLNISAPLFDWFFEFAQEQIPIIAEKMMNVVDNIGAIATAFVDAGPLSSEFGDALALVFGEENRGKITAIQETIGKTIDRVGELVAAYKEGGLRGLIEEAFGPTIAGYYDTIQEKLDEIKGKINDVVAAFNDGGIPAAVDEAFGPGTWEKLQTVWGLLQALAAPLAAIYIGFLLFSGAIWLVNAALGVYNVLMLIATIPGLLIVFGILGVLAGILAIIGGLWYAFSDQIKTAKNNISAWWDELNADTLAAAESAWVHWQLLKLRIGDAIDGIKAKIDQLKSKLETLRTKLQSIMLPYWLTPGSPTPFELGLRGINKELDKINAKNIMAPVMEFGDTGISARNTPVSKTITIGNVSINNGMDLNQFQAMLRSALNG